MKIELHEIAIKEIVAGYVDDNENGVVGYGGALNIRPAFQREFVYNNEQRKAVIQTVLNNFPLNVMYWLKTENGYEMIDGQQRTLSICQYCSGEFSLNEKYFHSLTDTEREQILQYPLMIYICEGNDKERLDWFETINIAGEKLTKQELRNANYTGTWLYDAKCYFSKKGCQAHNIAKEYLQGSAIRQDYLEQAILWHSEIELPDIRNNDVRIREYMARHQHDTHATPLWQYFESVINWVKNIFVVYRKEMKGVDWGRLYNEYGKNIYNPQEIERKTALLMQDDDVQKRAGIYEYLLSGKEKSLNIRAFSDNDKRATYERQNRKCGDCGNMFDIVDMEAHHKVRWIDGGHTTRDNCIMLCKDCHDKRHGNRF